MVFLQILLIMNPTYNQNLRECLFLKRRDMYEKVNISDILYVEAGGSSLKIVTNSKRSYVLSINLKKFTSQVTNSDLVRVHRSFIVNLAQVNAIKGRLLVVGEKDIPFSDSFIPQIGSYLPVVRTV